MLTALHMIAVAFNFFNHNLRYNVLVVVGQERRRLENYQFSALEFDLAMLVSTFQ